MPGECPEGPDPPGLTMVEGRMKPQQAPGPTGDLSNGAPASLQLAATAPSPPKLPAALVTVASILPLGGP